MNLNEFVRMQACFDEAHNFPVKFKNNTDKYRQLTKDLVGLFGEIGEFSNVVKKINIKIDNEDKYALSIEDAEVLLCSELTDSLIYVLRIAAILDVDLEAELLKTMGKNINKYESLLKK